MPAYRVYLVGSDGRFIKAIDLDCNDDDAAIEAAKQRVDDHDVELWQLDRHIARFFHRQRRRCDPCSRTRIVGTDLTDETRNSG